MKTSSLLLAGSLAANAALLAVFAFRPALAPPAVRDFFTSDQAKEALAASEAKAAKSDAASKARAESAKRAGVWASLQAEDMKSFIARLRAAGFSPVVIRAIVSARLEAVFSGRMAELATLVDTPYWKPESIGMYNNPKLYETQNQIYRDRSKMLREILGDEALANSAADATAAQRRQFGDLPKAKIELVRRIMDDYAEMGSQVRAATQGITLPEDREKLALLEKEKHADLAAVLTPAELEDIEMRSSNVTNRLRTPLNIMNASTEEFTAIYRAIQPYADILYPSGGGVTTQAMATQRTEAQAKVNEQLKATLGAERFAEYTRVSDYDYQNLYRLAQRDSGISLAAINQVYDLRTSVAAQSMAIHENKALSPAERTAALQGLITDTKAKMIAAVGSNVADAYVQGSSWLSAINNGYAIRIGPDGRTTYMSAPRPPTTATPGK